MSIYGKQMMGFGMPSIEKYITDKYDDNQFEKMSPKDLLKVQHKVHEI